MLSLLLSSTLSSSLTTFAEESPPLLHHAPTCALLVLSRLLARAAADQSTRYRAADYNTSISYVAALSTLHNIVRAGICRATRILDDAELPPLDFCLDQLPLLLHEQVWEAIQAEQRGECDHTVITPLDVVLSEQAVHLMAAQQPLPQ